MRKKIWIYGIIAGLSLVGLALALFGVLREKKSDKRPIALELAPPKAPVLAEKNAPTPPQVILEEKVDTLVDSNSIDLVALSPSEEVDTLAKDHSEDSIAQEEGEIVIAQDQLLSTLYISPSVSELKGTAPRFTVEFWTSPIHFRGYRWKGNKIELFGWTEGDNIRLSLRGDSLWLESETKVFLLEKGSEYKPYKTEP